MKILITGISSKIILRFVSLIDLKKHQVTGISRNTNLAISENISIIQGNLKQIDEIIPKLKNYDLIIHAAAVTHSKSDKEYFRVNLEVTQKLVAFALKSGIKKFIYISSNTAGMKSGTYGKTKYLAEEFIRKNFHGWLIFKISEVFGVNNREGIDQQINTVLNSSIILCPSGIPDKFYPIHLNDVAQSMYMYIFENEITNESITINGAMGYSFIELIELIRIVAKKEIKIILIPKWVMVLVFYFLKIFPFFTAIAPDQIQRLYANKTYSHPVETHYSLLDFIQEKVSKGLSQKANQKKQLYF